MHDAGWWIDHAAHMLHHGESAFSCSRELEAMAVWEDHALLLSSDTDCLSLWDAHGLVQLARVGVYPQDMALHDDHVYVCGGLDCCLHQLSLPSLQLCASLSMPGMPERIAMHRGKAYTLLLVPEPEPHTQLISVDPGFWTHRCLLQLPGIPGAIAADDAGLWIGVSQQVLHLPESGPGPDMVIDGIGLASYIEITSDGILVTDSLTEHVLRIRT